MSASIGSDGASPCCEDGLDLLIHGCPRGIAPAPSLSENSSRLGNLGDADAAKDTLSESELDDADSIVSLTNRAVQERDSSYIHIASIPVSAYAEEEETGDSDEVGVQNILGLALADTDSHSSNVVIATSEIVSNLRRRRIDAAGDGSKRGRIV